MHFFQTSVQRRLWLTGFFFFFFKQSLSSYTDNQISKSVLPEQDKIHAQ